MENSKTSQRTVATEENLTFLNLTNAENEYLVTQGGRIRSYVLKAMEHLQSQPNSSVRIIGKGPTVGKAISVTEIIKRRMEPSGKIAQDTQIAKVEVKEMRENSHDTNGVVVTRTLPAIIITLKIETKSD